MKINLTKLLIIVILLTFWLAVIVWLLSPSKAEAGQVVLNFHLTSWHSNNYYTARVEQARYQHPHGIVAVKPKVVAPYNKENFGFGLGYAFNDQFEARAGFYDNSHDNITFYIGGAATTSTKRAISVGVAGGFLLGGYEGVTEGGDVEHKEIIPFITPIAQLNIKRWRIEPGYVPKITSDGAHIVTLTAGMKF